jgi:hypothetical protein
LIAIVLCGALIWFTGIQLIRLSLKLLLGYKGWMYEDPHEKKVSTVTMIWLVRAHFSIFINLFQFFPGHIAFNFT